MARGESMPVAVARTEKLASRNDRIKRLDAEGVRQEDIAKRFGITQGRVSQIVRNENANYYYDV